MTLAKAKLALSITFIVLASFTIVTYDRQNMFIIQATGVVVKWQQLQARYYLWDWLPRGVKIESQSCQSCRKIDQTSQFFSNKMRARI